MLCEVEAVRSAKSGAIDVCRRTSRYSTMTVRQLTPSSTSQLTPSLLWSVVPCPHCRRKVRLSQKIATVAEFRRCLAVFGDSRTFLRQCGHGFTVMWWRKRRHGIV